MKKKFWRGGGGRKWHASCEGVYYVAGIDHVSMVIGADIVADSLVVFGFQTVPEMMIVGSELRC